MNEPVVLRQLRLQAHHRPTGNTRHYAGDGLLPPPAILQIVQFSGDAGFYLLYLNENGEEMTDTYHDSLIGTLDQAEFEFSVKADEWDDIAR
jgi:hypothetical protein